MGTPLLKANHITKAFNGVTVLDNVDFSVDEGEVHALVGGNGAGKSTLMKIITGVYTHDSGTLELDGKPLWFKDYSEATKNGVRMIFQELSLVPTITVAQNIFLNHEISNRGRLLDLKKMNRKAAEILDSLGVEISPATIVGTLSVAEQQLIEIAKALSEETKILVMDEPTSSLSETEVETLFRIVRKLKEQGVAIVYISHRMNEILKIADKVTILRDGQRIITEQAEVLTVSEIIKYMLDEHAKDLKPNVNYENIRYDRCVLEVKGLTVNSWVRNIDFKVYEGEVVGFAGLMNSGRTEILEGIFGLRHTESGEILVDGKQVPLNRVDASIGAGMALVPENRREEGLVLGHSLETNMILPSLDRLRKKALLDRTKIRSLVEENVQKYNIKTDSVHKMISQLSGGNQQKVVFAKWLSTQPKLVMFDEPTIGVDIGAKTEFIDFIRGYVAGGNAAIFVSSEISELVAACDRIFILNRGKICAELSGKEIENEEVIQNEIQQYKSQKVV